MKDDRLFRIVMMFSGMIIYGYIAFYIGYKLN